MPLTQEKLIKSLDTSFSNNNDHSYLHKKFKKMASTVPMFPSSPPKVNPDSQRDADVSQPGSNTFISNGSISAAHPEIEKIKEIPHLTFKNAEQNVQINISNEARLSNKDNMQMSGHTIYTEEFSNKTENLENEFIRETQTGGNSGRLPYECPYCKLCCAKPSVLQKHIRAHTNERPYPCVPCGFAFKTKSNLYKHRRSRTHALRLLGADVPGSVNDDESAGSESDTSIPPMSSFDTGPDVNIIRNEAFRPTDFSSPELTNDSLASTCTNVSSNANCKLKSIYKPKFRAAFYQDLDDKDNSRKHISSKADFLTEHISKIISDNEAIVDVIETPLQKKYNKIKLIAESKQFMNENDTKLTSSPLNLTKQNNETDTQFRKRSHSESFSHNDQLKNLNPEGSIIKDLLLKANGLQTITSEAADGVGPLYVCPLCQIMYRSLDNLEIHRLNYCKGSNHVQAGPKSTRTENMYMRSNSVNVKLPENQRSPPIKATKLTQLRNKPDNLTILKPEPTDVIAPLPSPGPLLGHTRLVDARTHEYSRKPDNQRVRQMVSPKRRIESNSEIYSPRALENVSPKSDVYMQSKIRCIDANSVTLRAIEEMSTHGRHNSTSLQMFGGEVKILDHSGSTTTLRIEPSKNQLSPIMIHQSISPSKLANDAEASSVVVRSGLHSGGTIVHNPPTPKDAHVSQNHQPQRVCTTPRSTGMKINMPNMQDVTHFQFPPLSAITAYNPLTLPPLSPSTSPNGAMTILHGGKLIPHVPGIPGPNTPGLYVGSPSPKSFVGGNEVIKGTMHTPGEFENYSGLVQINKSAIPNYNRQTNIRSPSLRGNHIETDKIDKQVEEPPRYTSPLPIIKVRNVDEPNPKTFQVVKPYVVSRTEASIKRNADGVPKTQTQKEIRTKTKDKIISQDKYAERKTENNIRHFNFENLITKAEIYNNHIANSTETMKSSNSIVYEEPASALHERSETSYFKKNTVAKSIQEDKKSKFLRPSTLPLKPGTFTPKRHHGITPNANTMPLVSPETPRPAKAYGQLYLNGNAYTYLGLKCSTKVFYCTINRPQPTYVPNQHFLSMYSNWQLLSELTPDPLGLSAASAMSLYDSRHRPQNNTIATMKQDLILTHSSQWNKNSKENKDVKAVSDVKKMEDNKLSFSDCNLPKKELTGGFESNEEYTYVRGRGRGRYVCSECGIRCKKPSMLKKHIRTHTDVRPYTCIHCAFSFKTKGNLTKHMKSKAHYKKCCELGINPNEGQDADNGEAAHCSGETDDDSDSDGDEGNEGETESSDTEMCKSRLPDHEAAHCLLSLGGSRPATSATSGLMSARPSTYPYTPAAGDSAQDMSSDRSQVSRSSSVDSRMDLDNEPMDLSKSDVKVNNITEIPTARESSVLASLASNTAKLPQHQSQWPNGEPMLHTYLTERALLDSKIKQSQLSYNLNKKEDVEKTTFKDNLVFTSSGGKIMHMQTYEMPSQEIASKVNSSSNIENSRLSATSPKDQIKAPDATTNSLPDSKPEPERKVSRTPSSNAENAKQVVSEYLKQAKINLILDDNKVQNQVDNGSDECKGLKINTDDSSKEDTSDSESIKLPSLDHDSVARKVVVGMGGVAFKVSKGKDYDGSASFSPSRLMEDGRRVCDFCNKTFTKPSQLRLHLNIHYMERPFRCSVCAVSFRTRGHLQKHERSGSHHNKVSMTSTFGAATSCNPRPFRCFDCNIAFRIHGHLAKHLRSKMHVMRLECLFKLPFGTFTEIERAGVSLTEIDTTDCASSLASLQTLARKLHEKDPTKLEYHEPNNVSPGGTSSSVKDSGEEECLNVESVNEDSEKNSEKIVEKNECNENESSYL